MKYNPLSTKNTNRCHCLLNKVAASLLSVKPCTVAIITADGSHHYILDMKPHDAFPCSADNLHW